MGKKRYGAIDGLRMIAAFSIIMMHIAANNTYQISGVIYEKIIPSFTDFVFLFLTISAFGMCCGYKEMIQKKQIDFSQFYGSRFKKVLPFFGFLVLLDIIISPSIASLYEAFADITLLFGFLPEAGNLSVIGVGWFLGLLFVFYLCFPFFCILIENRKRAWITFGISLIYNFVCSNYFEVGRSNLLYSACFFIAGGLIYLYREEISQFHKKVMLGLMIGSIAIYYSIGGTAMTCLFVSAVFLMYAVNSRGRKYWKAVFRNFLVE